MPLYINSVHFHKCRKKQGLSMTELARQLGVERVTLYKWTGEGIFPGQRHHDNLIDILNADPWKLFVYVHEFEEEDYIEKSESMPDDLAS